MVLLLIVFASFGPLFTNFHVNIQHTVARITIVWHSKCFPLASLYWSHFCANSRVLHQQMTIISIDIFTLFIFFGHIFDFIFSNRTWIRFPWLENNTLNAFTNFTDIGESCCFFFVLFLHVSMFIFVRFGVWKKRHNNFVKSHKFFRLILKFWMVGTLVYYKSNFKTKTNTISTWSAFI